MPYKDIARRKEYDKKYYKENRELRIEQQRLYSETHKDIFKQKGIDDRKRIQEIKITRGCIDCGYNKHPVALDFDHINGERNPKRISNMPGYYLWHKILAEMDKCEIRCANCHRIKTYETGQHISWVKSS